jgi:pilus assembly protein CpaB
MSPGQANRRFLMLAVTLGLLGAVLVYAAFSRGPGSSPGGVADTPVVVAKSEIPARTRITAAMVEVRLVPAADRSELAYASGDDVVGQVTRFPVAVNEQLLKNKVVSLDGTSSSSTSRALSFVVPQGMRGFAINVSEVQNGGGLVLPGDYVDIIVMYDVEFQSKPGDPSSREKADAYFVQTLLQNVEVLAVSQQTVDLVPEATPSPSGQRVRNTEGKADAEAKVVTLAVTPDQAQRLYLAEGNGRIRLAVRAYGDSTQQPIDYMTEIDLFPRNLPNPFLR